MARLATLRLFALALVLLVPAGRAATAEPLRIEGSHTLLPLVQAWTRDFELANPEIPVAADGRGSATGAHALLVGKAEIAAMSRPLRDVEREACRRLAGGEPLGIAFAADAIAVYVHETNPLAGITLAQLDAAFSEDRRCGHPQPVRVWGDLGLEVPWNDRRITLFGRDPSSGTHASFKHQVLCDGAFRDSVRERPGGRSAAMSVAEAVYGMGYGSRAELARGTRALPVASAPGQPFVAPTDAEIASGRYPLSRRMRLFVQPRADGAPDPRALAFLRHALSETGQVAVREAGFLPLTRESAAAERAKLDAAAR